MSKEQPLFALTPEPVQEFTDEEFEEIGREILKLFSRLRQNRTRRRGT